MTTEEPVPDAGSGTAGSSWTAAPGRRASPVAVLRAVVSATTWLAVVHLFAGLLIGSVTFALVLTGLVAGIATLPLCLLGVPVLAATFWLCGLIARAERARFALMLGVRIPAARPPAEPVWWRRMVRPLTSASAWRDVCYALLRFPLSLVQVVVLSVVWSLGPVLLALPLYGPALPGGGPHLDGQLILIRGHWSAAAAVLAGVLLLLVAPQVTYVLAAADAAVGGWLLGSAGRAELTARIGELETSRARVMDAAETERMRIERDLHDGAQQRLVSLAMELGRAKAKFSSDPDAAAIIVGQAHEQAKEALAELRNLVRGVHPPVLSDRGLDAALSGLAALSPVPVTVRVDLPVRPPVSVEAIAYFVVAEALTNVAKHARASRAEVTVCRSGDLLSLVIYDDGVGGADPAGQGLSGLAARVAGVDGRLWVTSPAGGPTSVEVALPCGS
jgi:signal transduction histidine kinase